MDHLSLNGIVDVVASNLKETSGTIIRITGAYEQPSSYHHADDPQQGYKHNIEGDKEAEEATHCRHPTLVRVAVDIIIGNHIDRR